jgi:hydrogenase maturation protein HypF
MGRLFDAAAAILGVRRVASYEGQAAMELEALASRCVLGLVPGAENAGEIVASGSLRDAFPHLEFPVLSQDEGPLEMDPVPLLAGLGVRSADGEETGLLAAAFHVAVGRTTVNVVVAACRELGIETVALGGGVFQNSLLVAIVKEGIEDQGLHVLVPERLGPNDGGISYGQAVVAAARLADEQER